MTFCRVCSAEIRSACAFDCDARFHATFSISLAPNWPPVFWIELMCVRVSTCRHCGIGFERLVANRDSLAGRVDRCCLGC